MAEVLLRRIYPESRTFQGLILCLPWPGEVTQSGQRDGPALGHHAQCVTGGLGCWASVTGR